MAKFVLDTSIIIDGEITKMLEAGDIEGKSEIIIPLAVLDELQAQASTNKEHGFVGLAEIKKMRELASARDITVRFSGARPDINDIRLAKHGRIDAIIKDVAMNESATLLTADYVQALVAEAQGIKSRHIRAPTKTADLAFEKFFDESTMSVHLKENVVPMAKRGKPGNFQLVQVGSDKSTYGQLNEMVKEISEASRVSGTGTVEISRSGATVIQFGLYRIAITRPPFSDGLEVTIVRPTVRLALADYHASEKLMERLSGKAEGIIIAGPPGSGKSTLASSLAEFYVQKGKIVKTFESPRDLQVPEEVTQYGPLEGSFEKAVDILLLVRPDYTIYDEVRRAQDFDVFADMRLAGVGMVGVVHASSPLDAVQRFMGKVELGMIPHILDTIIFVREGRIDKVYELSLTVKVPSGMTEADLARPLVEVRDFESGAVEYEIYTYGEENVVVPLSKAKGVSDESGIKKLAQSKIMDVVRRFDPRAEVNILSENRVQVKVSKEAAPKIIGRGGSTINELEEELGVHIDVEVKTPTLGKEVPFEVSESGSAITLLVDEGVIGRAVDLYIDDEYIMSSQVGKKARVKIDKRSDAGKQVFNAIVSGQEMRMFLSKR
ncbi:PINc/VapC family ATPase [Nitrososphaera viennensis]|uniref:PINc/VapC family ATPase n=2 Tax=Nitrososphaera viennensis TaxID=1034015 RepID=A0A977IFQ0_9ARCH|nr:PINc/VapC family ATPase [Nitrososphaera viennensis]AIC14992.1 putative PilT domain protein/Type II secretion system protein E [Nitrososphaera viennensis EN76]UVS69927.1 PINc/VapC family ATPase [Nitrososphaera viennensis]